MKSRTDRKIEVRGARVHNLKNVDVDIPLNRIVGIAGVPEDTWNLCLHIPGGGGPRHPERRWMR